MGSMSIDGLVSGLDTTSLIKQLMQVEAIPQSLLKTKSATSQTFLTALQGLNTRVASLTEAATTAAKPASWTAWAATSSAPTVTATASATAQAGSLSFSVDAVAASQISLTAAVQDDGSLASGATPSLTVKKADGTLVTVTAASSSLADLAKALNDAPDTGVKASVVRVSAGEPPTFRLQLTGSTTGTDGAFELYAGSTAEVSAAIAGGTAVRLDGSTARTASQAQITLWKGSDYAESFSQSSNTFADLMTGVSVTVSKVTAADEEPVTISVSQDAAAVTKLASGLVGAMGVVLAEIAGKTATTTKTNADGTTTVTGGIFSADSAVRAVGQQIADAMSRPVDGTSPTAVGIVLGRDGSFTFDEKKFAEALAADPAKVQAMVTTIADRVATAGTRISDKYEGSLTLKIQGQEGLIRDYGTQIESWDRRLAVRESSLQRTYSGLEVMLSKLNAQSSWLSGQLSSLSSSSGG